MIALIVIAALAVFGVGYVLYGGFLARHMGVDDSRPTPANTMRDGVDYVPARPTLLLGQHFSAIAAAGPIVGPILAGVLFGWLPTLLWIVLGALLVGGVHDFSALVASVRHKGASIGQIVRQDMSRMAHVLFLVFVWLALIYVMIAFTDITAQTFKAVGDADTAGPGSPGHVGAAVAASSVLYLLAGLCMGICLHKLKLRVWLATAVFLPVVLFIIWVGPHLPAAALEFLARRSVKQYDAVLLAYCFVASVIPVWLLLQPRGYLGGWLLYLVMAVGLFGALFGGFKLSYPAVNLVGAHSLKSPGKALFPMLFITVACGACSGFHGIVSSGTTSKQLTRESHARPIGYGAMLLEGVVAVLALATLMMLAPGQVPDKFNPNDIYSDGIAAYLGKLAIPRGLGKGFALLVFSTFVYDTLDVCTRLARHILQELLGWRTRLGAFVATLATLVVPLAVLMTTRENAWKAAWELFGTSNQLLASLTLLAVSVWLVRIGKSALYTLLPMGFMMAMTMWSLVLQARPLAAGLARLARRQPVQPGVLISGLVVVVLFVLSLWLLVEAIHVLARKRRLGGLSARADLPS